MLARAYTLSISKGDRVASIYRFAERVSIFVEQLENTQASNGASKLVRYSSNTWMRVNNRYTIENPLT